MGADKNGIKKGGIMVLSFLTPKAVFCGFLLLVCFFELPMMGGDFLFMAIRGL